MGYRIIWVVLFFITRVSFGQIPVDIIKIKKGHSKLRRLDFVKVKFRVTNDSLNYVSNVNNLNVPRFFFDSSSINNIDRILPTYFIDDSRIVLFKKIQPQKKYTLKVFSDSLPEYLIFRFLGVERDFGVKVLLNIKDIDIKVFPIENSFINEPNLFEISTSLINRKNLLIYCSNKRPSK
jgi:hypothetical protein